MGDDYFMIKAKLSVAELNWKGARQNHKKDNSAFNSLSQYF